MKVLSVIGTRPEAIKMAPVLSSLAAEPGITSLVCVTAQHRYMLDQVLAQFAIRPDFDLDLMEPNQDLNALVARIITAVTRLIEEVRPDRVLVHGDTTTALAAAMAAFRCGVPVGHVEAGLRSHDINRPWPEELNRRLVDLASDMLFAPTPRAGQNLEREEVAGQIFVTGNTVIDALASIVRRLDSDPELRAQAEAALPALDPNRKLILVTGHRRESFGEPLRQICLALAEIARRDDVQIVYPVHLNPKVQSVAAKTLAKRRRVHLLPPLDYLGFVRLMQMADLILTDSGGVQEEAPWLGKPVLVMRDVTERPEAVALGGAELVGADPDRILTAVFARLDAPQASSAAPGLSPYGDGRAAQRIVAALTGRSFQEFRPPVARPQVIRAA